MYGTSATLKLAAELLLVGSLGLAALIALVLMTVDRLNVRVAQLEALLAARGGRFVVRHPPVVRCP